MSVELIDDGRIAGEKARNADVDASAGIKPLKIEKKPILIPINFSNAIQDSADLAASGAFPGFSFADAAAHTLTAMLRAPLAEITPGERAYLHIWWTTSATTGQAKWTLDIKPILEGFSSLASAITRSVITQAGSANVLLESVIELPPAVISNGQVIGIKISRDGTATLDTIAAAAVIRCVYLRINGRC
jgi:hypothetical protein